MFGLGFRASGSSGLGLSNSRRQAAFSPEAKVSKPFGGYDITRAKPQNLRMDKSTVEG